MNMAINILLSSKLITKCSLMRARNIKPAFFKDEKLLKCSLPARMLFAGLWCYSDREGRFVWNPFEIKIDIFPVDHYNIDELLNELVIAKLVKSYGMNGKLYGCIPNFLKHQNPHPHESRSKLPKCNDM